MEEHKQAAVRQVRGAATYTGVALSAFMLLSIAVNGLIRGSLWLFPGWPHITFFGSRILLFILRYMIPYVIILGLPFPLTAKVLGGGCRPLARRDRVDPLTVLLLSLAGLGAFVVANLLTDAVVLVWTGCGLPIPQSRSLQDGSVLYLILELADVAVLPALLEECAFRGFVLERLRPLGERFAVIVSALFFGLAHGNVVQIPFAFVLGLFFGFVLVRTGNIFLTIWLHFLNNGISVLLDYARQVSPEYASSIHMTVFMLMLLAGVAATAVICLRRRRLVTPLGDAPSVLSRKERRAAFFLSPAVIVAFLLFIERFVISWIRG